MKKNNLVKLFTSIIICELAGVVGAIFTTPEINGWYKGLNKPFFNPPSWIFGPAWTTIFILMGISLYLVWIKKWIPQNKVNFRRKKLGTNYRKNFYLGHGKKRI